MDKDVLREQYNKVFGYPSNLGKYPDIERPKDIFTSQNRQTMTPTWQVPKEKFEALFVEPVLAGKMLLKKRIRSSVKKPQKTYVPPVFKPNVEETCLIERRGFANPELSTVSKASTNYGRRKGALKFGEAFEVYSTYAVRLKSYNEIMRLHKRYLKHLDCRSVSTISKQELQLLHSDLGRHAGPTAANRTLEQISAVINHVIDLDLYAGSNPVRRIKKFRLKSRERYLKSHELPRFFAAVERCQNENVRDFVYFALWTSVRSGNIYSMRWQDLDLIEKTWRLPDSKNGDPYTLPLPDAAMEILTNRFNKRTCGFACQWATHSQVKGPPFSAVGHRLQLAGHPLLNI